MYKIASTIITTALVISLAIVLLGGSGKKSATASSGEITENVEMVDGTQFVTIKAKGGYSPRFSNAQSGIPTKLLVQTKGTYDCSSALVIRSIGFEKMLPQKGEEVIDLGSPKPGEDLQGMCSMGMYNFSIRFI